VSERLPLLAVMFIGTLPFFLADEWLTRGDGAKRGAYPLTKLLFLVSLGIAVALDYESLSFLPMILPVWIIFFILYGLFSRWSFRRTGNPLVAGIVNAVAFAWALAVTFPMYAGVSPP
ncbi:alpha/beta hydrolase, partial [Chromatium okenii]|nr:alpha/beta hydrolase [Chromatium okenii]